MNRTTLKKVGRVALRFSGYALVIVFTVAVAGAVYQALATTMDHRALSPPGEMVDVGEGRLHINCSGEGNPTVVLDAGGGGTTFAWRWVQDELAETTRVCSFDRMGFGWSDPIPRPHTSEEYVALQETLLRNAGEDEPYVLVGHSLGGQNAQLFARQHPEKVAGMVLVDSAHEEIYERLPEFEGQGRTFLMAMRLASRLGIVRLALSLSLVDPLPQWSSLSAEERTVFRAEFSRPKHWDAAYDMNVRLPESAAQVRAAGPPPDVPLVVITHGIGDLFAGLGAERAARAEEVWKDLQLDLARRSSEGQFVVAEESGHDVPLEQPEIVVEAVREVWEALD